MIQIKAVDAQNILDVCGLSTDRNSVGTITKGCSCCNAISIAEAKYDSEMHPYAIYHNKVLIGFFMYRRTEEQADTATICRFMLDSKFWHKGLEEKAMEHILRGLKIQGVKKVIIRIDGTDKNAGNLPYSFGFHLVGSAAQLERSYELEL